MTLSGTKRYSDKSGEYYLKNVLNKNKRIPKKIQANNHKSCDFDNMNIFVEGALPTTGLIKAGVSVYF